MLERRTVQVKLLAVDSDAKKAAIKVVEKIEGVLSVNVSEEVLTAEIGEWASDYDVLVSIINGLSEELSVEVEPIIEENLPVSEKPECEADDDCGMSDEESEVLQSGEEGEVLQSSEGGDGQSDKNEVAQNPKKDWIFKISEWGVALILFIVGAILSGGDKTYKVAPYLQMLAFTIAGYEVCFSMLSKILNKNFINEEIFIVLTSIAAVVLQNYEYSAVFMIIYGGLQVAIDGVKLFALNGEGECFTEAASDKKIKKIVCVYTLAVFIAITFYAFISPAFSESYKTALKNSGTLAVLLAAAAFPFSFSAIRAICLAFALKSVRGAGIKISAKTFCDLAKTKSVLIDANAAEIDGESLKHLDGAVLELYDSGVENVELLSSGDKTHASELRKALNMRRSASMLNDEGKIEEIRSNGGKNKTAVYVSAENNGVTSSSAVGTTIGLGEIKCEAVIDDKDAKKIPYLIKFAKRTSKLNFISSLISIVVKVALFAFIFTKLTDNAYVICLFSALASAVGLVVSFVNKTEIN